MSLASCHIDEIFPPKPPSRTIRILFENCNTSVTPWTVALQDPLDFPGKNTGLGSGSLLQGIFLTQRLNPGLLHFRPILYHLSQHIYTVLCLVAQSCLTHCDFMGCSLPGSSFHRDSPGKNTGVGSRSLLQGILPISSGNFFTYMDSAEDLRGTLCRSLEFSLHPSPSLVFCRVITGCHDFPRLMSHPRHSVGRGHREDLTAS